MTALSIYALNTAAADLLTANNMTATTGGTGANSSIKLNNALGWGEIVFGGTTNVWAAAGSIGAPTGNGGLWDVTTLEGNDLLAGNWGGSVHMSTTNGNVTATIVMRAFKWNVTSHVFAAIGSMTLAAQSFTSTLTVYNMPSTAFPKMSFGAGDKLYVDVWCNVTSNSGSTTTFNFTVSSSAGRVNNGEFDTAGYAPTPVGVLVPVYQRKRVGILVLA